MKLNVQKNKVVDYIKTADDNFINMVNLLIDEYEHKEVAGYSNQISLSEEDIIKRVLQASARVKSGNYISQDSLEKEVANW